MTTSSQMISDMSPVGGHQCQRDQKPAPGRLPPRRGSTKPASLSDGLLILALASLMVPARCAGPEPGPANNSAAEQQVDDLLKDTIQLLDALDDKLASVKNSSHLAMVAAGQDEQQPVGRLLNVEPSMDDALIKITDSFSSSRRPAAHDDPRTAASSGTAGPQEAAGVHPSNKRARQLNAPGQQQADHHQQYDQQQQQLANDSTERHIKFTLDLMQSIFASQSFTAETKVIESFLISPLSIQAVLMMMHLGARGQTKREIGQCLHLTQGPSASEGRSSASIDPGSEIQNNKRLKQRQSSSGGKQQHPAASLRHQASAAQGANATVAVAVAVAAASQPQSVAGQGPNPHELFGAAMRNLLKDPIVTKALTSANQIFLQKNLPLSAQYESAIRHFYGADVKPVDFQHQTPAAGQNSPTSNPEKATDAQSSTANNLQFMINDWIERQTKGRITNLLSSPIATSTLMMAINVLYFKGDWQYKFDPADTETDAWFTQANGKAARMPMMVNRLPLAFAHDPAMKTSVIELPYKAQRLGLFLLLPDEVSGIFRTMQMLNSSSFTNLISSMRKPAPGADQAANGINVRIPKFSIESSPRLSQLLSQRMGLKSLFMPDMADLSGMFGNSPAPAAQLVKRTTAAVSGNATIEQAPIPQQVALDELLHKAVLQVDEQGSVAAASSATIVERVGLFNSNYFEADHPFLLFLMDKKTGLVLFAGVFAGNSHEAGARESGATIS